MNDAKSNSNRSELFASFYLGAKEFAVPALDIQEVVEAPAQYTVVPDAPDYMLGVFNLRNMLVPVLDARKLLGYPEPDTAVLEPKVVIFTHNGLFLALLFDSTSEIFKVSADEHSEFGANAAGRRHISISAILKRDDGQRLIQVLKPHTLFSLPELPLEKIRAAHAGVQEFVRKNRGERRQAISFSLENRHYAFDIKSIQEIIWLDQIRESVLITDSCIGMGDLRGAVLPIVDFGALLNLRPPMSREQATGGDHRILVMKLSPDHLVGLVVDQVHSLAHYFTGEINELPSDLGHLDVPLFAGSFEVEEPVEPGRSAEAPRKTQVLLFKPEQILGSENLRAFSEGHIHLYRSHLKAEDKTEQEGKQARKDAFITFRLNRLYALPIGEIHEIVDFPGEVLQPAGMRKVFHGSFLLRGHNVGIIDSRKLYDLNQDFTSTHKILVLKKNNEMYGLVVEDVEAIRSFTNQQRLKMPSLLLSKETPALNEDIVDSAEVTMPNGQIERILVLNLKSFWARVESYAS